MRPGDRRDGQPLIFGWGRHLTRAEKQKYRERFVLAAGAFVFALIALVIGIGALQQFFFKPRIAVAKVNGATIERQWYDKNLAYTRFVLSHEAQDLQSQFQALAANQRANAAATATANPEPAGTPAASAAPISTASAEATAAPTASPVAEVSGTPSPSGTATVTVTPSPTFNPQESATVAALTSQFSADQTQLTGAEQQTVDALIDVDLMRQNAVKFGLNVTSNDVSAQAKKTTDRIGGDAIVKQLFQAAHLSQNDFNQIQSNEALRDKFRAYFADHPDAAPPPTPTPELSPTVAPTTIGPQPPTPTATPAPVPTPGADSLDRWLEEQKKSANIYRAPFPLPS